MADVMNNMEMDNVMESTVDDYMEPAGDVPEEVTTLNPGKSYAKPLIGGGIAVVATAIGVGIWRRVTGRKYVERPARPIGDVLVGRRPGNKK